MKGSLFMERNPKVGRTFTWARGPDRFTWDENRTCWYLWKRHPSGEIAASIVSIDHDKESRFVAAQKIWAAKLTLSELVKAGPPA